MDVDNGLEDIMWIRGLGGDRSPTAYYALRLNLNIIRRLFFTHSRRYTFDLDIESTHSQPASCRARPDDHLENSTWIHGVGGERLAVVSYVLCSNVRKCLFFAIGEGSRIFVVCFLYTSGQIFFFSDAWQAPAT